MIFHHLLHLEITQAFTWNKNVNIKTFQNVSLQ